MAAVGRVGWDWDGFTSIWSIVDSRLVAEAISWELGIDCM